MSQTDKPTAFKNWINSDVVNTMATEIASVYKSFDQKEFSKVAHEFAPLELKDRVLMITRALKDYLPSEYDKALKIIVQVMKRNKLKGFSLWPFSEYIGQHGLEHFDESMQAMHLLTQKFTSEFAIRPYFIKDASQVLSYFKKFAHDENEHVRRWVSEGSRPLLPWGLRLSVFVENPHLTLELLEILKFDEALYVRKSIANHLNDISKHHPKVVIDTISSWIRSCPPEHADKMAWIKRQGLRTLIKKGHPGALKLMGVGGETKIKVGNLVLNKERFKLGDKIEFSFVISSESKKEQKLVVDYLIHFVKSNGSLAHKVYKLKSCHIKAGEKISFKKSHSLKPIATMKWYRGEHAISVQVNGKAYSKKKWFFDLKK